MPTVAAGAAETAVATVAAVTAVEEVVVPGLGCSWAEAITAVTTVTPARKADRARAPVTA